MPLEDLIRHNANQSLSAHQKCLRAIAWIQNERNDLNYDGIIAYLRIVDKYEANSSKFLELSKNKLSSHAANNHRTGLRHVWMKHERNRALDYQQFIELYRLVEREDYTYPWIYECNISFDRIKNFVADKEEGRKASIFTLWLGEKKNKISEQELLNLFFDGGVFAEFSEQNKKKILDQYVKSTQGILPTDARLLSIYAVPQEQAVSALQFPLVRPAQSSLAARSTSAQSITVPAKQEQKPDSPFVQLIKELATTLPLQRDAKIKDWFSKNNLPFKEFESFFTKENPNNVLSLTDSTQNTLLISWFEKEGNILDPIEFLFLFRTGKLFSIESLRTGAFQILRKWLVDTRNVNLTIRLSTFFADMIKVFSDSELLELLKLALQNKRIEERDISYICLQYITDSRINFAEFRQLFAEGKLFSILNDQDKIWLANNYISTKYNPTAEEFLSLFSYGGVLDAAIQTQPRNSSLYPITTWLQNPRNNFTVADLKRLFLGNVQVRDVNRFNVKNFVTTKTDIASQIDFLKKFVIAGIIPKFPVRDLQFSVEKIFNFEHLEKVAKFYEEIYPGAEGVRADLLENFIKNKKQPQHQYDENVEQALSQFLLSIRDTETVVSFVKKIKETFGLQARQVVKLLENRSQKKYSSIFKLIESKTIEEVINAEDIAEIIREFGGNLDGINFVDLFVYYDFLGQRGFQKFVNFLKPEFRVKINETFRPADVCYFEAEEYQGLKQLVPSLDLPQVKVLTSYLKDKIKVKEIKGDEIDGFQINFSAFDEESYGPEVRERLNRQFKTFLTVRYDDVGEVLKPDDREVISFFETLLKMSFDEFGVDGKKKFCEFFNGPGYARKIGALLQEPDGIEVFLNRIASTIRDGCHANISNVMSAELQKREAQGNPEVALLLTCFMNSIFLPITNHHTDLIVYNRDPLTHTGISNCYLSPLGLAHAIGKSFGNINKQYEYLAKKFNMQDHMNEFQNILQIAAGEEYDFNYLDPLTYCFVLMEVPEIFDNKYFMEYRDAALKQLEIINNESKKFLQEKEREEEEKRRMEKERVEPSDKDAARAARLKAAEERLKSQAGVSSPAARSLDKGQNNDGGKGGSLA